MKCEDLKLELPGLLWGELAPSDREKALKHLAECPACQKEWQEFKAVQSVMSKLGEENPLREVVFIERKHPESPLLKLWNWLTSPGALQWGLAAALILIALALAKPSLSLQDGKLSFAFGKIERIASPAPTPPPQITPADLEERLQQERSETLKLVAEVLQKSSEEQRRDFTLTLTAFARDLEKQRQQDLTWMTSGMQSIQRSSQTDIMRTNRVLEDLIKTASYQEGK